MVQRRPGRAATPAVASPPAPPARPATASRGGGLLVALVAALVISSGDPAEPQGWTASPDGGLRLEWTLEPARGRWHALCGYIHNDTPLASREVRLRVEGRDQAARVIDVRTVHVLGHIAPWGRTYFCSTAAAGASRYSVTVVEAHWGSDR